MEVKQTLISRGVWSQYLEVGIGPDAEVFTKAQPMSTVGYGADIGVLATSHWNNPEPEVAVVVSSDGRIVGATLGNDVNLRDLEGRSALLLGKAKDNNASASLGPFIRLFDNRFTLDTIKQAEIALTVKGEDGFELLGSSSMRQISRSPEELVAGTIGPHHQYPDGMVLYLGTMFAPVKARDSRTRSATSSRSRRPRSERSRTACSTPAIARPGPMARATSCATSPKRGCFSLASSAKGRSRRGGNCHSPDCAGL
jgi:fumarylacetoacetate (FAA) hydrolase family protein